MWLCKKSKLCINAIKNFIYAEFFNNFPNVGWVGMAVLLETRRLCGVAALLEMR